jgi:hypothetical protein
MEVPFGQSEGPRPAFSRNSDYHRIEK